MSLVSVCVASYNGEQFIEQQLVSILSQIDKRDEVILVDDASTDRTLKLVKDLADDRIKIVALENNVGHVKAFEIAISLASKEIIFLSDQDDIWVEGKYQKILRVFDAEDSIVLAVHSLSSISEAGDPLSHNWIALPAMHLSGVRFLVSEFFVPRVWGSASAFKRELLEVLLPFPKYIYRHEYWLAICAALTGDTKFLNENLVLHRLHDDNFTSKQKAGSSLYKKLYLRYLVIPMTLMALYRVIERRFNWRD